MNAKKILGLDLGTNSIGWAIIEEAENKSKIMGLGSRIVPMDSQMLNDFSKGQPTTKNVTRRQARSARRLIQRYKLRRNRLITVFNILGWMPVFSSTKEMHEYLTSSPTDPSQKLSQFELYELRDKATREFLSNEQLARIFYHLNQRRGFLSNRKIQDAEEIAQNDDDEKEEDAKGTVKTYEFVQIRSIEEESTGKKKKFNVSLEDGRTGFSYQLIPFVPGKMIELQVNKTITKKWGTSFFFQLPKKLDWNYRKHHINRLIEESGLTVGQFYYRALTNDPNYRTKDNIILREKYLSEFETIWQKQMEFRAIKGLSSEMTTNEKVHNIAKALYKNNIDAQNTLIKKGLKFIIKEDIIYYQRPLKSQKDSIANCRLEKDKKVIPMSHPLYQEFRILDKINNLRIRDLRDNDHTAQFMTADLKKKLVQKFNEQKTISPKVVRDLVIPKNLQSEYFLSENDEKRPFKGNETLVDISTALEDEPRREEILTNPQKLEMIWHCIYSLNKTDDVVKALTRPKNGIQIQELSARKLAAISYPTKYGAISARAIKKLMPLMQWHDNAVDSLSPEAKETLNRIINHEADDNISDAVRFYVRENNILNAHDFKSLPFWVAASIIYGTHTSIHTGEKWSTPDEIKLLPKNHLRNPIVQQITNEALQLVGDIWRTYGQFDEIRIELARDLKNNSKERESISEAQIANKKLNESVRLKLQEIGRPISDSDRYRLWLENLDETKFIEEVKSTEELKSYINYIKPDGKWKPDAGDINKYKLWAEQMHLSPYSGKPIPLSALFNKELYEIDHIIPRQRFYDDSLSNKVVVEAFINRDKGTPGRNLSAWEYMSQGPNKKEISLLSETEYVSLVNRIFRGSKRRKLLMKEIPSDFVERQKKDTQYITLQVRAQLAKIVGIENVHTTTGGITDHLREHWGIAHLFKELLLPRFEALERKLQSQNDSPLLVERVYDENLKKHILKLEGYSKRLDHRHHAADALVIACTKPSHIKRLNDLNKIYQDKKRESKELIQQNMNVKKAGGSWAFEKPWDTFVEDAKTALEACIVSVKNRNRLLTKSVNHFKSIDQITLKKEDAKQVKGKLLSVRGPLHNPQPYGETKVNVPEKLNDALKWFAEQARKGTAESSIKERFVHDWQYNLIRDLFIANGNDLKKINAFLKKHPLIHKGNPIEHIRIFKLRYTKRTSLASLTATQVKLIANDPLKKEIEQHIQNYGKDGLKKALSADGLAVFNQNRKVPIHGVKVIDGENQEVGESLGKQKLVRKNSLNTKLHINTAGNFAFAIYENEEDIQNKVWPTRREFDIVSFYDAVQLKLHGENIFQPRKGMRLFTLSHNDLVYLPRNDEKPYEIDWTNKSLIHSRLFTMTKASGNEIYFVPLSVAEAILKKVEFGTQDAIQTFEGISIKNVCIKVKIDRIGRVTPAYRS